MLESGFIREVRFSNWLTNVVMVKKSPTKWRICEDYTDLNKVCPKILTPPDLSRIMDDTIAHELLSFMDALAGYNQIKIYRPDEKKTTFMTDQ